jgi:predicted short-subunit dehydrogenase-like oxidoreductase (DUF2520 family)
VFVIGGGAVATAMAMKLSRAGFPVAGLHARRPEQAASAGAVAGVLGTSGDYPPILKESDILILAVSDEGIAEVAAELARAGCLRPEQVLLHCSGALSAAEALAPARGRVRGLGTLHPLISFADPHLAAAALRGATMTVEGDEAGRDAARTLAQALGGVVVEIEGKAMPLYHAAAVLACNYTVALVDAAAELLVKVGFPRERAVPALIPLLAGTVRNLSELGLPGALTGPVARGEVDIVARHLAALLRSAPQLVPLYRAAGLRAVEVSRRLGRADGRALQTLAEVLRGGDAPPPRKPAGDNGHGKRRVAEPGAPAPKRPRKTR